MSEKLGPMMALPTRYENKLILKLGFPWPLWLEILEILAAARQAGLELTPEQIEAGGMFAELVDHVLGEYVLEHEAPKGSA
jgi:hypothetical protein